jgi:thiamine-phosphate pyrophosphorylase
MTIFPRLPRLYPILDAGLLLRAGIPFEGFARELREAGIRFLQYRDKDGTDPEVLGRAQFLRSIFPPSDSCLILNDRVSLAGPAGFDGVHVGQEDLPAAQVRQLLGSPAMIGFSTHNQRQLLLAGGEVDYLAIGPVFATSSKQNPDPVIGLEGVRAARELTPKPLVAIGGISRANCLDVLNAGADSVAVIADLLPRQGETMQQPVREFLLLVQGARL